MTGTSSMTCSFPSTLIQHPQNKFLYVWRLKQGPTGRQKDDCDVVTICLEINRHPRLPNCTVLKEYWRMEPQPQMRVRPLQQIFQTEQNSFAVDARTPLQRDSNGKPISEACGEHTSEQYTQERRVRQMRASWARDSKEPRTLNSNTHFQKRNYEVSEGRRGKVRSRKRK